MTGDASRPVAHSARLYDLLLVNDFAELAALFESFFASIPYEWYTNNDIASYEGFYASVFYSYFAGLGLDVVVEDSSSNGRLDMAVRFNDNIYLFERAPPRRRRTACRGSLTSAAYLLGAGRVRRAGCSLAAGGSGTDRAQALH